MKIGDWVFYENEAYKVLEINGDVAKINPVEAGSGLFSMEVPVVELEAMTKEAVLGVNIKRHVVIYDGRRRRKR